jgi:chemotaxis protein histidine kinase CheA
MHNERIISQFLSESYDTLDLLGRVLTVSLEDPQNVGTWKEMLICINTLRNLCRLLGFRNSAALCFEGEMLVNRLQQGFVQPSPEIVAALNRMVFAVQQMLKNIESAGREGQPSDNELIGHLRRLQGDCDLDAGISPSCASPN